MVNGDLKKMKKKMKKVERNTSFQDRDIEPRKRRQRWHKNY
jgi:hypothetical protein